MVMINASYQVFLFHLELHHLVGEAHALLPDDVLGRHPHVLEGQNGRVRGLQESLNGPAINLACLTCMPILVMVDLVMPLASMGTTMRDLLW